jgi:hypothetical protein
MSLARPPGAPTRLRRFALLAAAALAGCGGGGPLDNPPLVANPAGASGQKLSFEYFQRCVQPVLLMPLPIRHNGVVTTNTCAGSGCHDNANGTGGAFRIEPAARAVDLADPANTPEAVRETAMYRNFYSAQGEVVIGAPLQSRLLAKPLVRNVLHGGGQVFETEQDPNAQLILYWITHPMPAGHDEFSSASAGLFGPGGECLTP